VVLELALRNALRSRRRTLLAALAISGSFALLIVFLGIGDGVHEQMVKMGVSMGLGDLIVEQRGYRDRPTLDNLIVDAEGTRRAMLRVPGLRNVAARLRSDALISAGTSSVGVALSGVDPAVEPLVSKIDTPASMVAGRALGASDAQRPPNELAPVVIGHELAQTLSAEIGDRVTLTLRPAGGGDAHSGAYRVSGIFRTGVHDIDAFWCEVPLPDAQILSGAGDGVTMLAGFLDDVEDVARAKRDVQRALDGRLAVLSWMEAAPDLYALIAVDQGGLYVMMVIVFIVVVVGILNTLLMSVLERTREFGMLLALGATPGRVLSIVFGEAFVLGVAAISVGLAVGLAANQYLTRSGISLAPLMSGNIEVSGILMPKHLYAHLHSGKVVISVVAIMALVLLGAAYPALRAARLEPVEAIGCE
jgi:ABC-type lipoprotein release transport system permease subunit